MAKGKTRWTDEFMDQVISVLLRTGVLISSAVVLIGGILYLAQNGHLLPNYHVFRGEPSGLRKLGGILAGVKSFHSRDWMQFGLLILVATPVARVAFSVFGFMKEKDRTYVALTVVVFLILMFSLFSR